jgi:hypothetical protein
MPSHREILLETELRARRPASRRRRGRARRGALLALRRVRRARRVHVVAELLDVRGSPVEAHVRAFQLAAADAARGHRRLQSWAGSTGRSWRRAFHVS